MDRAAAAKEAHAQRLMVDPAILAVGVGVSEKNPSQAVVNVYVQQEEPMAPSRHN